MRTARIVFIGDDKVGKSTLINCIISESFQEKVHHIVPVVTIPPDASQDNISTQIIDTASDTDKNREAMEQEITRADALVLIYAIDKLDTVVRVRSHWLPLIRRLLKEANRNQLVPIVLVGNKADLRSEPSPFESQVEETIHTTMREFKEVETWLECSAKKVLHVQEVFFFAQKAVLYPQSVLFDQSSGELTPKAAAALQRIYRLCDRDNDGVLDDEELNEFQFKCFGARLQEDELKGVKEVVLAECPQGVTERGLTSSGFLFLHLLFIQRGRLETTWTVLRKFGYADDLELRAPTVIATSGQTAELSISGLEFLTTLFHRFDKDRDEALNSAELDNLFATSPTLPWDKTYHQSVPLNQQNHLTMKGFLALWRLATLLDYKTTVRHMSYLGSEDAKNGVIFTRGRKEDVKNKQNTRNVLQGYVLGSRGSGKTQLLKGLAGKPFAEAHVPTTTNFSTINSIVVGGEEKFLVLREFADESALLNDVEELDKADVIVLLYDGSDASSFSYIPTLYTQLRNQVPDIPHVFVRTKADLPQAQDAKFNSFLSSKKAKVHGVSLRNETPQQLYIEIITTAIDNAQRPQALTSSSLGAQVGKGIAIAAVLGVCVFAGRWIWKAWVKK